MSGFSLPKKPKIETVESEDEPEEEDPQEESNGASSDEHIRNEQEEALVALFEHREKEVEHLRQRITFYKSQLADGEKNMEDTKSKLVRVQGHKIRKSPVEISNGFTKQSKPHEHDILKSSGDITRGQSNPLLKKGDSSQSNPTVNPRTSQSIKTKEPGSKTQSMTKRRPAMASPSSHCPPTKKQKGKEKAIDASNMRDTVHDSQRFCSPQAQNSYIKWFKGRTLLPMRDFIYEGSAIESKIVHHSLQRIAKGWTNGSAQLTYEFYSNYQKEAEFQFVRHQHVIWNAQEIDRFLGRDPDNCNYYCRSQEVPEKTQFKLITLPGSDSYFPDYEAGRRISIKILTPSCRFWSRLCFSNLLPNRHTTVFDKVRGGYFWALENTDVTLSIGTIILHHIESIIEQHHSRAGLPYASFLTAYFAHKGVKFNDDLTVKVINPMSKDKIDELLHSTPQSVGTIPTPVEPPPPRPRVSDRSLLLFIKDKVISIERQLQEHIASCRRVRGEAVAAAGQDVAVGDEDEAESSDNDEEDVGDDEDDSNDGDDDDDYVELFD